MKHYTEIDGWFSHTRTYTRLIDSMPSNGTFVEVGAWLGRSTSFLCANASYHQHIVVVDTWLGSASELLTTHRLASQIDLFVAFTNNLKGYTYTPYRIPSKEAAKLFQDGSLDVVFIDAEHTFETTKEDIQSWLPKVKSGGYIAGHDYSPNWKGVMQAVDEIFAAEVELDLEDTCWLHRV